MNKFDLMMRHAGAWVNKHSSQILIGMGIGSSFASTALAVTATPKAMKLIEERKRELNVDKLTPMETVKTCWKCYISSGVVGTVGVICLVSSNAVSEKRNAALAAAYSLSEATRLNYRDKVIEVIGEKKEQEVRDAIAKEEIKNHPIRDNEVIMTRGGNTLCYDSLSGRYFRSSVEKLKRAENEINRKMLDEMYVSLNDFYDEIGLTHIDLGDMVGWNTDKGLVNLWFSSQLTPDDEPCLLVSFQNGPDYNYDKLY